MFNSTQVPASTAGHSALAFGAGSANLGVLSSAIDRLEAAEVLARKAEAARVEALAAVDLAARVEAVAELSNRVRGRAVEDSLAYRAARAEAATALHLSEQATSRHLAQAAALSQAYSDTVVALSSGEISMRHALVILEAGSVIGPVGLEGTPGVDEVLLTEIAKNRASYEAQVLAEAASTTPNRLRPIARRIAEKYALEYLDTRYEREKTYRSVWVTERECGMAELGAYLPAHEAYAIHSRLTQMAKRAEQVEAREAREALEALEAQKEMELQISQEACESSTSASSSTSTSTSSSSSAASSSSSSSPSFGSPASASADSGDSPVPHRRTRGEIRTDLFVDLLLNGTGDTATGGPGTGTGISGIVQLIAHENLLKDPQSSCHGAAFFDNSGMFDAEAATGPPTLDIELPEMGGYGPIPVGMARDIAAGEGTWSKINVNLRTGDVLTVDRYRPSEQMRRFLAARDRRCRFPGCRVPVHRCDFDHTVDAALGGPTSTDNLGALCRGHHLLKHHTGWQTTQRDNGDYEWTSPTGRSHLDEPVSRVRFVSIPEPSCESRPTTKLEGTALPKTELQGTAPSASSVLEDAHPF